MATLQGLPPADAEDARRAGRTPTSLLIAWVTALAFIAFLIIDLFQSRMSIERQLREEVSAVTRLAAECVALILDAADRELVAMAGEIRDDMPEAGQGALSPTRRAAVTAVIVRALDHHPDIASLTLLDADGHVLAGSSKDGVTPTLDRERLLAALRGEQPRTIATTLIEGPDANARSILIARSLEATNGRTAGALLARVKLEASFRQLRRSVAIEESDIFALHDADNVVLAGDPVMPAPLADTMSKTLAVGSAVAADDSEGAHYVRLGVDGSERLAASRKVATYPFHVAYGRDPNVPLAIWRHQALAVALASLLALTATTIITQGIRRRAQLARQMDKLRSHLEGTNRALRDALAATELLAAKDQLTGLWNRRSFDQRLQESIAHLTRHQGTFSLLLIDIDHFKSINDRYGHVVGDEVLKWFAGILEDRLRQNDVPARWGGEEFAILVDGASLDNALVLAEQIRAETANNRFGKLDPVTVSIGVAEYRPGESDDDILVRADHALYDAKRGGRNRVVGDGGTGAMTMEKVG